MGNLCIYVRSLKPAGGLERVVAEHANMLEKKFNVSILTDYDSQSFYYISPDVQIRSVTNREKNLISKIIDFYRVFSKMRNKNSLFYVTYPIDMLKLILLGVLLKNIIITEHASFPKYNIFCKLIVLILYRFARHVFVPNKLDYFFISRLANCHYIPNPNPYSDVAVKIALGEKFKNKTILAVGRLHPDKNHIALLRIWKRIINLGYSEWSLKIIGEGECEKDLRLFVENNSLKNVSFYEPKRDIEKNYAECTILCLTSKKEGFGMVLVEALHFATPVIAFDCPSGPADIIIDGQNGYIIQAFDEELFAQNLIKMMSYECWSSMSLVAQKSVNEFHKDAIAKKWFEVLLR
jgi:glycosyltransferase involved in cell wall biosynthesis